MCLFDKQDARIERQYLLACALKSQLGVAFVQVKTLAKSFHTSYVTVCQNDEHNVQLKGLDSMCTAVLSQRSARLAVGHGAQAKTKELKNSLNQEFRLIHELCLYVLNAAVRPDLVRCRPSHVLQSTLVLRVVRVLNLGKGHVETLPPPAVRGGGCLADALSRLLSYMHAWRAHLVKVLAGERLYACCDALTLGARSAAGAGDAVHAVRVPVLGAAGVRV